jgi:type I restriction enzyme S subunit
LLLCDKTYRLRAKTEGVLPDFLELVLNDPFRHAEIDDLKTGTSESGMNLTQAKVRALEVPVPRLEEQREIVLRVSKILISVDDVLARLDATRKQVDRSSQAVLAKAFRGQLLLEAPA